MDTKLVLDLSKIFENSGLNKELISWINMGFGIFVLIIVAWTTDIITKKVLMNFVHKIAKRTATDWDDILLENKVFKRIAHVVPALIVYFLLDFVPLNFLWLHNFLENLIEIYIIIMVLLSLDSFVNSAHQIYNTLPISKSRAIGGYVQVLKIFLYFIAIILIISIVIVEEPSKLLTGLGAMAAVLILVFKDTILGFVASIQLSANDMVRIGEWISMPSHKADGTVEAITLNTVKVQNWDKTISTIPTYALVSESFSNWRGMEESGGRRIKRNIQIDMNSVKFCSSEMIERFKKVQVLQKYIHSKENELTDFNNKNGIDDSVKINGRRMTNLGTFRIYLEEYLKSHPKIHNDMTFLVRQLQPNEKGIPIEIYVFSNDQAWANFEAIQADIFDHILAVIPEFELRVFQNPSGDDFQKLRQAR